MAKDINFIEHECANWNIIDNGELQHLSDLLLIQTRRQNGNIELN